MYTAPGADVHCLPLSRTSSPTYAHTAARAGVYVSPQARQPLSRPTHFNLRACEHWYPNPRASPLEGTSTLPSAHAHHPLRARTPPTRPHTVIYAHAYRSGAHVSRARHARNLYLVFMQIAPRAYSILGVAHVLKNSRTQPHICMHSPSSRVKT